MLLVVTNRSDLACDYLILRLKERSIPFRRLNTEDYAIRWQLSISVGSSPADFLISFADGTTISRSDITAVYFRQPVAPAAPENTARSDRDFVRREQKEALRSLWRLLDPAKWLNHPTHLWLASNKIEQLCVARDLGFSIPETCVTSTRETLNDFFEAQGGQVICKAVKHGFMRCENIVSVATTQRVGADYMEQFDGYAPAPMIYQREIPKACDVRVTVVGDHVFPTAIHSQQHAQTEVDWRLWDVHAFDLRHEAIKLPDGIETRCRDITRHFNLRYSAIDLILATDGDYYFLEMNPNGQWAWIERKTGQRIRDAIIDCLALREEVHG